MLTIHMRHHIVSARKKFVAEITLEHYLELVNAVLVRFQNAVPSELLVAVIALKRLILGVSGIYVPFQTAFQGKSLIAERTIERFYLPMN